MVSMQPVQGQAVARVSPRTCKDAGQLASAGWQWCATNRRWWRTSGPKAGRGACPTCVDTVAAEATIPPDEEVRA